MNRTLLMIALLALAPAASAMTLQGAPPVPPSGAAPQATPPMQSRAQQRDDSAGLRKGTVEAVNGANGTLRVYGQTLTFDTKRVMIFGRNGKAATVDSLRAGSAIRFTLDPRDAQHRQIAVIYVD